MKILLRTDRDFMTHMRDDLARPHDFAVKATFALDHLVLLADQYFPVADDDYVRDYRFGAVIGQNALRTALEFALLNPVGMFHVHPHFFSGRLWFSGADLREQQKFVPDFFSVRENLPHGALVLSRTEAAGRVWLSRTDVRTIDEFDIMGGRVEVARSLRPGEIDFLA